MKCTFVGILMLFIFCSCSVLQHESNLFRYTFNDETFGIPPAFNSVEIVPLETTPESLISEVHSIDICDSFLFVKDRNAVFIFRQNGTFVAQAGRQGTGPEEYISANSFYIDKINKQVVILDHIKSVLMKFDFNGNYVSSEKVHRDAIQNAVQAILYDKSTLVCANRTIQGSVSMGYTVLEGEKYENYFPYPLMATQGYSYFLSNNQMAKNEDEIHCIIPFCDTIFSFSNKGFEPKYIMDLPTSLLSREKLQTSEEKGYWDFIRECGRDGYFSGFSAIFETEDKLLLEYRYKGVQLGYYLSNKNTYSGNYYVHTFDIPLKEMPFFNIKCASDNTFIGVEDVSDLLIFKNQIDDMDNVQLSALKKVINALQEDDNPVLFFYHSN